MSNCIYEIDPNTGPTGSTICPGGGTGFSVSQRGLAYDPATDTYFAGSWNDLTIYRFRPDGTILSSVNVGISIAGLAYNPETEHLFVVDSATTSKVYVLDAANNYAPVGQFTIAGFGSGGAGMEIDCDGNLWLASQADDKAYQVQSGETASLCGTAGVPWLSEAPTTATVPAGGSVTVDVTLDSTAVSPGV